MMTLKELIRYTDVANRKVIAVFEGADKPLPEAGKLFSHVLYSSQIWISRLRGEVPSVDRFDVLPVSEFASCNERVIEDLYQLVEHSDLSAEITYRDSKGNAFTGIVSDILFHVVNHSTYHRAQVATQFRLNGLTPPMTDFILLKRKGEL